MLRHKSLIPLSHQHQHALALCVRLERAIQAGKVDLEAWQAEIQQHFELEISVHFAAEEKALFPSVARVADLEVLARELLAEHKVLRAFFAKAKLRQLDVNELGDFGKTLSAHIRKEERQLFESIQRSMQPAELTLLGENLEKALVEASQACLLPSETTKLRPRN